MSAVCGTRPLRWLFAAAIVAALAGLGLLEPIERWFSDRRAELASRAASERVVVVGIDAEAQEALGRWPWPRRIHADLVARLIEAGVTRIGLDIDLSAPADEADDRALAAALAAAGSERVALAGYRQLQPMPEGPPRLAETVPAASLGSGASLALVNVVPDADGLVRTYPTGDRLAGAHRPSLAHWLIGAPSDPGSAPTTIDFAIDVATIPYWSVADLLAPDLDRDRLHGRLVLVGAVDPALGDTVTVPRWRALPGVLVHALAAETLLRGRPPRGPENRTAALVVALLLLAVGPRLERVSPLAVALGGGALLLAAAGASLGAERAWSLRLPLAPLFAGWLASLPPITAATLARLRAARAAAAQEAERRRRLLEGIVGESFDGILTLDPEGRVSTANPAAGAVLGLPPEAAIGRRLAELAPALEPARAGDRPERREVSLVLPGGRRRTLETVATRLVDPVAGEVGILVLRDVSQARATAAALDRLLHRDEETGLPNRRRLEELLDARLREPAGDGAVVCLVVALAEIEERVETDGPEAAAEPLGALAASLATRLPAGTVIARVATDALACVPPGRLAEEAVAELADHALQPAPGSGTGHPGRETLRAGLALGPADARDGRGLLRCALWAARRVGEGGGWARYAPAQDRRRLRRARLLLALRAALRAERLDLVYQPEVDTWTGVPVAVEALVRWHDPELGPVSPAEFVPLAEEAGLIDPLTRLVVRRAMADAARLAALGAAVPVAVNLSARSLEGPGAGPLVRLLAEAGGTPDRLALEITETAIAGSGGEAVGCLASLREAGYAIALDDFGVGYSSFARLRELPVTSLKLDRALVRVRPGDRSGDLVLQTILELAERLGLATVGEGVEEAADLERLRAMGCTHAQGFHIARPMPTAELARWLTGRSASADPALPGAARHQPAVAGCDRGPAAAVRGRAAGPPTAIAGAR
jgi:predicted signal transduction protein with EAL and GGDEF domain/CHASE2 domain-containing sensor protein